MKNIFLNPIIDVCIKIVKYSMQYAVPIFLLYLVIFYAIEFPIFGIILLGVIIVFYIWYKLTTSEDKPLAPEVNHEIYDAAFKLAEEKRKKKQKEKNIRKATMKQLIRKLPKDFETIIEKNFKVVASAYRTSVTSNAFNKKNYDKFIPQLIEYLQDNSKIVDRLDREFDKEVQWNEDTIDHYIKFIETKINESNSKFDYSDDMDPYDYEHLCAEEFKKNKWDAEATQGSSDQGVDVIAKKDTRTLVAQCKRFMKPVGNKAVQEIVAGMKYYEATEGVVIAPNGYTNSAKNLAEANNIKLIHHSEIGNL
jgi:restriction system protein